MTNFPHVRLEYTGRQKAGRTLWLVLESLAVQHPELNSGDPYPVPGGWETDLASVPRRALTWLIAGGNAPAAAVVHDWLYRFNGVARDVADRIFRDLVLREGYSYATAYAMWAAVRVGGWRSWNEYRKGNV